MKNHYIYSLISIAIVSLIIVAAIFIEVPIPGRPMRQITTIETPFRFFDTERHLAQYDSVKIEIKTNQFRLAEYFQNAIDSVEQQEVIGQSKKYLFKTIKDDIIPYWYHTKWDFNGTTEEPRKGYIACGYFVTTVLRHAGFHLDKYLLAREASRVLIQSVCNHRTIRTFKNNNQKAFYKYINRLSDGIYILGLDTHVGFILKTQGEVYFIHSRQPVDVGVVKERAIRSSTIAKSSIHVIGDLLDNDDIIQNWLTKV